jgi:hypothetical protein
MRRLLKELSKQTSRKGVLETCNERSLSSLPREKLKCLKESEITHPVLIAKEPTILRRIVGIKTNLLSSAHSAIISAIMRNIAEQRRNNLNSIFTSK